MNALEHLERALGPTTAAAIRQLVREEVARGYAETGNGAPWMTVEEVAAMLGTSKAAIHTRLANGWMSHARIREGRRVLINRQALLAELERKRRR
jgi:excisionase family DNA binding protein